jgi:hypothetical protein
MKLTKSKLKEMIKEELLNEASKPEVNEYVRDGGMFGKIVHIEKMMGKEYVFVELQKPKSRGWMSYLMNNLKATKNRNVGKVIWGVR